MHSALNLTCDALDALSEVILRSWTENRTLAEVHGWHHPPLTRHDLAAIPKSLAIRIREENAEDLDQVLVDRLTDVPRRLQLLHATTVPYMFNGNGHQAVPAFIETIKWLADIIQPEFAWQSLQDNKAMPTQLAKRLRGIQADIESLVPNREQLSEQIRQIREATDAAESLPTDLQRLKEARDEIGKLSTDCAALYGKIDEQHKNAGQAAKEISLHQVEADKLVKQCGEAYRITTSTGLAAAFDQRAKQLGWSMWVWVAGLVCALAIGAMLGANRVVLLTSAIANQDPQWGVIWMHITLSILSVGAPLWFAWIATKQIAQRFKMAEDYGFKASVAKAYEGYRREAARLDPAFEARLFLSALTRLEEAPLRLVDHAEYGSPWHELVSSDVFQQAMTTLPALKERFLDIAKISVSQPDKVGQKNITVLTQKPE